MEEVKEILKYLKVEGEKLEIPCGLYPNQIRKNLRKSKTGGKSHNWRPVFYYRIAACLVTIAGLILILNTNVRKVPAVEVEHSILSIAISETEESEYTASLEFPEITYEDIYESMFGNLKEKEEIPAKEAATGTSQGNGVFKTDMKAVAENREMSVDYGVTNVRTRGVEEGDIIKNDGRYLYQIIDNQSIQIVDTKEGLEEVKRLEGFKNIAEFYIWENCLVVIENKYLETAVSAPLSGARTEKVIIHEDIYYPGSQNYFHEISFYNIEDRADPCKIKTFTLKGSYDSSRISDGYFYSFSKFYADPGKGKEDYASYIPLLDGVQLDQKDILLPEENRGNCYLVLTSVDMSNPTEFVDTAAIVTDSDLYYVSNSNLYVADSLPPAESKGKQTNSISLLRFAYEKGKFSLQAKGQIPGNLESSFSMDEYKENLRLVTTVDEYWYQEIKDDVTGELLGNYLEYQKRSNALYVLDFDLKIIGKVENLAEEERIYSARFLGEIVYFVTFRQTDPLFAVDLKDPEEPKVLSELKISGFSEYLHLYEEKRLLGIGMEADENTGTTAGMKLSMFDISDPGNVGEIAKLNLKEYQHSDALYNHKAVMISPEVNLFGFEAEGYQDGDYSKEYLLFSYEQDQFIPKLKVQINKNDGKFYSSRGTFIGEVFYLLTGNGGVKSYNLKTFELKETLE